MYVKPSNMSNNADNFKYEYSKIDDYRTNSVRLKKIKFYQKIKVH